MVVGRTKDVDGNVAEQVDDLRERMRLLQGESTFVNLLLDFDIRLAILLLEVSTLLSGQVSNVQSRDSSLQ